MSNMMNKSTFEAKPKNEVSDEVRRKKVQKKQKQESEDESFFTEMLEEIVDDEVYTLMRKLR